MDKITKVDINLHGLNPTNYEIIKIQALIGAYIEMVFTQEQRDEFNIKFKTKLDTLHQGFLENNPVSDPA